MPDDELTPAQRGAQTRKRNARDRELLAQLIKDYESFEDANRKWKRHAIKARDYYDGKQWTTEELQVLNERKEPAVVDNIIKDKIDAMLGIEIEARTDIQALPREPGDEDGAEAATESLTFVADNARLNKRFSQAGENEWIEGTGGLEIVLKHRKRPRKNQVGEIEVKRLRFEQMYWDPTSMELDFSDSGFRGVTVWWDEAKLKARYPGKANEAAIRGSFRAQEEETGPLASERRRWANHDKKVVRVFHTYWTDADEEMQYAVWTRGGFLRDDRVDSPGVSRYLDDEGEPADPYVWQSTYIRSDGRRYGLIERLIDLQDETNKRRSKGLHYLNTNQIHTEDEAISSDQGEAAFRLESKKPDGFLKYQRNALVEGRVRIDKNVELAAANLEVLVDTRNRLNQSGPGEALHGQGGSTSGRHLARQQQGELIPLSLVLDRHQELKHATHRAIWARIKQFWSEGRWIRVRGEDDNAKFTPVNMPLAQFAETDMGRKMAAAGQPLPDVMNPISDMDFDISLDDIPDVAALQEEQFAGLIRLAELGQVYPGEIYLEASSLPQKQRLKKRLKDLQEQQGGAQEQEAQERAAAMQATLDKLQAEVEEIRASTGLKEAQTMETRIEAENKQIEGVQRLVAPTQSGANSP